MLPHPDTREVSFVVIVINNIYLYILYRLLSSVTCLTSRDVCVCVIHLKAPAMKYDLFLHYTIPSAATRSSRIKSVLYVCMCLLGFDSDKRRLRKPDYGAPLQKAECTRTDAPQQIAGCRKNGESREHNVLGGHQVLGWCAA